MDATTEEQPSGPDGEQAGREESEMRENGDGAGEAGTTVAQVEAMPPPKSRRPPPHLPMELILIIMGFLTPTQPNQIMAIDRPETQTLRAFALVCRGTVVPALRLLHRYCVYIDSSARLRRLLYGQTLAVSPALIPDGSRSLGNITSLYLGPFGAFLDDQPTAMWTRELLCTVSRTLTRLVIDMPLRTLRPFDDHLSVRSILRDGFAQLTRLEEFVSVRDELYLELSEADLFHLQGHVPEAPVWTLWPRLRRLALYNVDTSADVSAPFWRTVAERAAHLDTLVLTRADSLHSTCIKSAYLAFTQRPLTVVLVHVREDYGTFLPRSSWPTVDPDGRMTVKTCVVPFPESMFNLGVIETCQNFVKYAALEGTLFDMEGTVLT